MLNNYFFLLLSFFLFNRCTSHQASSTVTPQSIAVEYAYVGVADNDVVQKTMFGNTRYKIYADASHTLMESSMQVAGGLQSVIVIDNKTGEAYLCIELDTVKIKMKEEDTSMANQLFGVFSDSSFTWKSTGSAQEPIQGYPADEWSVSNPEYGKTILYTTDRIAPTGSMAKCPAFIRHDSKYVGFMLGNDQQYGQFSPKLRAVSIDLNKTRDVAATLASYRTVSKEQGNQLMQKAMK